MMYLPEAFRQTDSEAIFEHLFSYPFATLITSSRPSLPNVAAPLATGLGEPLPAFPPLWMPLASHVPLLVNRQRNVLLGHLARENPQAADLSIGPGADALAIFHGPHGYVSPSVYVEPKPSVPTWNYVVVHVRGRARTVGAPELRSILDEMVARFEPPASRWRLDEDPAFLERMLGAIVGFEMAIESIDAKWKLSQNRSPADREAVISWLEGPEGREGQRGQPGHGGGPEQAGGDGRALARAMRASLAGNTSEAAKS